MIPAAASMPRQTASRLLLALSCIVPTGCSIISPVPLWELVKGAGAAASVAIPYAPTTADNTVYHPHPAFREVCIEFNPDTAVPDIVPALQIELQKHQIDSRVYDVGPRTENGLDDVCHVWIKYVAYVAWDIPPLGSTYKPYVNAAAVTLRTGSGAVLATSHYQFNSSMDIGKWASTQAKIAPIVTALVTGF